MGSSRLVRPARPVLAVSSVVLLCGFVGAQDLTQDIVEAARRKADALTASRQHAEAKAVWEQTRAEAEAKGDRQTVAACESALGELLDDGVRSGEALRHFERALETRRSLLGEDHPEVAAGLDRVAMCLLALGRTSEGMSNFEAALRIRKRLYEGDHDDVAANLSDIGRCLQVLGRATDALSNYKAALAMSQSLHQGDHPHIAGGMNNVGGCLHALGRDAEAVRVFEAALEMSTRLYPGDHLHKAMVLSSLGVVLNHSGRPAAALVRNREAVAMTQRLYGGDHSDVALSLNDVASCLDALGKNAEALPHYEAALGMLQRLHAGDHPDVAMVLNNLADELRCLGKPAAALPKFQAAAAMWQHLHDGGDHPLVATGLHNVAVCLESLGRNGEALPQLRAALEMHQRIYRGDHPDVAQGMHGVARCLQSLGKSAEALPSYEAALAMWKRLYDGAHPDAVGGLIMMAACLRSLGRNADALANAEAALTMSRRLHQGEHPDVAASLTALALVRLEVEGNCEASAELLAEAIEQVERLRLAARTLTAEDRSTFFVELKNGDPYGLMRRAQARLGHPDLALTYTERARARGVLDLLASGQFDALAEAERRAAARGDDAGAGSVRQVKAEVEAADAEVGQIHYAMAKLADKRALADDGRTQKKAQLEAELQKASESRDHALRERARVVAGLEPLGEPASVKELQATLGEGELLLLWALDDQESHLFVVPPTLQEVDIVAITATIRSTAQAVKRLRGDMIGVAERDAMTKQGSQPAPVDARAFAQSVLPDAVWQRVRAARRVFAVPDGALHRLPLETLFVGERDGETRRWLDDGPPIAYVASGSVLRWLRQRASAQPAVPAEYELLAIGDPVFHAVEPTLPDSGVLVDSVRPDSQAAALGLRARDVLLAYDDKPLADDAALRDAMALVKDAIASGARDNGTVALRVLRDGEEHVLSATAGPLGVHLGRGSARTAWAAGYGQSLDEQLQSLERGGALGPFTSLPPLPGTRTEVEAIAKALAADAPTPRVRKLLGAEATEAAVFELAGKARYLHIATHGLADETEAASFSALALTTPPTASAADDGFLKLTDLTTRWGQRLPCCSMVVLSACSTQVGPQIRDEAPYALPLGFLYAGASSVVATQWMVADKTTAVLMADFYARIRAQGDKPDRLRALTEAKRALRAEYPNPYYWAAFVYVGSPD